MDSDLETHFETDTVWIRIQIQVRVGKSAKNWSASVKQLAINKPWKPGRTLVIFVWSAFALINYYYVGPDEYVGGGLFDISTCG